MGTEQIPKPVYIGTPERSAAEESDDALVALKRTLSMEYTVYQGSLKQQNLPRPARHG